MQLIFQMQQLANDQEYLIICNHSEEINKLVADIARQNYTAPREGFIMDNLQSVMELSDNYNSLIMDKLVCTIPTRLNAMEGSTVLAATSLLGRKTHFFILRN